MRVSRKAFRVVTTVILMLAAGCGGSGTTAPASDPPRVLDAAPGNGTSGVGIHKAVMVLFDRAMDNASFDNATVTLSPDIPGTIT